MSLRSRGPGEIRRDILGQAQGRSTRSRNDLIVSSPVINRAFVNVSGRPIHLRYAGSGPTLVLIHQSPTSGRLLEGHIAALSENYFCVAPDIPGMGQSAAQPLVEPHISDLAQVFIKLLDTLGIERAAFYGSHTGALIATELAVTYPERVAGIILDGYPIYTPEEAAQRLACYFDEPVPDWSGSHMHWLWYRYREQFLYWPWNAKHPSMRASCALASPDWLQAGVAEMASTHATYPQTYRSAFSHDSKAALDALQRPAYFLVSQTDSLTRKLDLWSPRPGVHHMRQIGEHDQYGTIREILDEISVHVTHHEGTVTPSGPTYYLTQGKQQLVVERHGRAGAPSLLVLPPLPAGPAYVRGLPRFAALDRDITIAGLPGSPGTRFDPEGYIEDTLNALERCAAELAPPVGLLAFGYSSSLVPELLRRVGDVCTDIVLVDPVSEWRAFDSALCASGGHLLRFWDYWRLGSLFDDGTVRAGKEDLRDLTAFAYSAVGALPHWEQLLELLPVQPASLRSIDATILRAGGALSAEDPTNIVDYGPPGSAIDWMIRHAGP